MWMASLEQSKAAKTACMACCFMINRMSARSSWVSSATAYDTLLLSTQTWKGQHRLAQKVSQKVWKLFFGYEKKKKIRKFS